MAIVKASTFNFRDAKGQVSHLRQYVIFTTGTAWVTAMQTLRTDVAALSNASVTSEDEAPLANAYGATGQFQNVEDKAVMVFQSSVGALHRYQIPAPKAAIFLADLETVDAANTDVAAWAAAVVANVFDRNGVAIAGFIGGQRARRKNQRRFSIWTKNPALTGPGE